ncbi:unnamed protein product [Arabidopsis lyrata]|uniref:Predicted protein n=1 Tax=Arabidopsis lyrata subsp. lyrata TaxID=81972 RepID=D7KWN7_ARALL|nr:uncharacterized protein LOC9324186 [Arabidopsis lyrata subsp. lyrata]EFH62839.1 predicted protein [Arabidopsis lyrata subsp. lyrata]CAH8256320.1 unnamed protein product [Arabidopsis lyrata]|eukprot:XP_002886580.1 uncharacterized protein LOC9324186 [Arabidopsis lyrata subsp. lyrata]
MEVPKSRRDQKYQRIQCLKIYDTIRIRERAQQLIDEIQQELDPENIISRLRKSLQYALGFYENWKTTDCDQLACLKIELDKLTFAHGACPDKKNVHNLNHRMLHGVHDMDAERYLLKMFYSKKHKESGSPLKKLEQQDKLREFNRSSVLSKKEIQKQIQVLEKRREEDIKVIIDRRKKLELIKREITRARPCSLMVWGFCSHPKINKFDPFLWGLCGCTSQKPLSKKNRETTIAAMRMKSLREKLESIREQRQRIFVTLLFQMDDLEYLKAEQDG